MGVLEILFIIIIIIIIIIHVCLPLKIFANAMLNYVFEDLDECDMGFCGEHGTCTNTVGSYVCTCFSGFLPGSDGICVGEASSPYLVRTLAVSLCCSRALSVWAYTFGCTLSALVRVS